MSNLVQRSITGILFVVLLVGATVWNQWSFVVMFMLITCISLWEFYKITEQQKIFPQKIYGILLGLAVFLSCNQYLSNGHNPTFLIAIVPLLFLIFIFELYRKSDNPFSNISFTLIGLLLIAVPFAALNYLAFGRDGQYQSEMLIGYFLLLWTNDTAAYFIGSKFGEHRLFERISPKKSWEGFWSGFVFNLLIAYVISQYINTLNLYQWLTMAVIVTVAGTYGDLVESSFKRSINYKDSGNILPGHGGILDRFDSLLLSAPFVAVYLYVINNYDLL
ncbi:MAG: phosphatidate cytidylyltransferase [Bacteroidetes bacterium]|nr:MAG: phosphatidate cytidylyltransferase [Bacteroidota bacterium]